MSHSSLPRPLLPFTAAHPRPNLGVNGAGANPAKTRADETIRLLAHDGTRLLSRHSSSIQKKKKNLTPLPPSLPPSLPTAAHTESHFRADGACADAGKTRADEAVRLLVHDGRRLLSRHSASVAQNRALTPFPPSLPISPSYIHRG